MGEQTGVNLLKAQNDVVKAGTIAVYRRDVTKVKRGGMSKQQQRTQLSTFIRERICYGAFPSLCLTKSVVIHRPYDEHQFMVTETVWLGK